MTHFIVEYADNGDQQLREQYRADHIAYRIGFGADMLLAGPLLDDAGTAIGSLVLIKAENRQVAERRAAGDPLVKAGVFTVVSIRPYRIAAILGARPD